MLARKVAISVLIFAFMFTSAWMANEKVALDRVIPSQSPTKGTRVLYNDSSSYYYDDPFKPREYIRVYPRAIP